MSTYTMQVSSENGDFGIHLEAGDEHTPAHAYTVGLSRMGRAELMAVGLNPKSLFTMLHRMATQAGIEAIADGQSVTFAPENSPGPHTVRMKTLDSQAIWPRLKVPRTVLAKVPAGLRQVIWSTVAGLYPGEAGYPGGRAFDQTLPAALAGGC